MSKLHILRTIDSGGKQELQPSFFFFDLLLRAFLRGIEGAYLSTFDLTVGNIATSFDIQITSQMKQGQMVNNLDSHLPLCSNFHLFPLHKLL